MRRIGSGRGRGTKYRELLQTLSWPVTLFRQRGCEILQSASGDYVCRKTSRLIGARLVVVADVVSEVVFALLQQQKAESVLLRLKRRHPPPFSGASLPPCQRRAAHSYSCDIECPRLRFQLAACQAISLSRALSSTGTQPTRACATAAGACQYCLGKKCVLQQGARAVASLQRLQRSCRYILHAATQRIPFGCKQPAGAKWDTLTSRGSCLPHTRLAL